MQIKATALVAFLLLAGCNADNPTSSLPASKHIEAEAEPLLGIMGEWVGSSLYYLECSTCEGLSSVIFITDSLSIELAPDPYPPDEPGVTYFNFALRRHHAPSSYDDPAIADLGLPSPLSEEIGQLGLYYAGGTWAFHRIETYRRTWEEGTKEYREDQRFWPSWDHEIKMFAGWLLLGSELFKRVDE